MDSRLTIELTAGFAHGEAISLSRRLSPARFGQLVIPWSEHARRNHPEALSLYYYLIHAGPELAGIATLHIIHRLDISAFLGAPLTRLLQPLSSLGIPRPSLRVGFLEVPLMNLPGLILLPQYEPLRDAIRSRIIDHARGRFGMHALCIKLRPETLGPATERAGLAAFPALDNAILSIAPFSTYDAYLRHLHKKRRQNIQRSAARLHGAVIERLQPTRAQGPLLARLFRHVTERARERGRIPLTLAIADGFFTRLDTLGEDIDGGSMHLSVLRRREQVIAFLLVLRAGGTHHCKYYGADPSLAREVDGYFNLLQYEVAQAIDAGCHSVDLGATSYGYKRRMGCHFEPMAYRVDVAQPLLRPLLGRVAATVGAARDR